MSLHKTITDVVAEPEAAISYSHPFPGTLREIGNSSPVLVVLKRTPGRIHEESKQKKALVEFAAKLAKNTGFQFDERSDVDILIDPKDGPERSVQGQLQLHAGWKAQPQLLLQNLYSACANAEPSEWNLVTVQVQEVNLNGISELPDFIRKLDNERPFNPWQDLSWVREIRAQDIPKILEREAQLNIINDALRQFKETQGRCPSHIVLSGPPGAAKSQLLLAVKEFLERPYDGKVELVAILDTPATTKAGFEKWLADAKARGYLPPIVVLEETEKLKYNSDVLLPLLSVMTTGDIRRLTAPMGRVETRARVNIWATCNNIQALQDFHGGTIYSRFDEKLFCGRPSSDAVMLQILQREVVERNGDPAWAQEALKFGKKLKVEDPRDIIGFLKGRERLMTGAYQADRLAIMEQERAENKRNKRARPGDEPSLRK